MARVETSPLPSIWSSARAAFLSQTDAFGSFTIANAAWLLVTAVAGVAGLVYQPAYVAVVLLVPVTCGLARMAGHAARGDSSKIRHWRDGIRHRFWLHLMLGACQTLLLALAAFNIGVGLGGQSLLFASVAVVSAYVALATGVVATAAWPLLLDPQRLAMAPSTALRLGLAVVRTHPIRLTAITLVEAALIFASVETLVLAIFLPSYGILVAAHAVLPIADRLESRRRAAPTDRDRRF